MNMLKWSTNLCIFLAIKSMVRMCLDVFVILSSDANILLLMQWFKLGI